VKTRRIAAIAVLIILIAGITGIVLSNRSKTSKSGLQVVAAENFWGDIAAQLGGQYVHVTSIITNPNADPHLYESDAQDAADVSSAKIVIVNGMGYDDFMNKLLGSSKNSNRQVITAQRIYGFATGGNPHLWYDIPRVPAVAQAITNTYIAKDPAHEANYRHNLTVFDQSLQPLLKSIDHIKQQHASTPVAYTEPVPGYMLDTAGLSVKTPEGFALSIEDGTDPSPADTEAMDSLMTNKDVKVLLYNTQTISPVTQNVENLAKKAGIPVIGVSETMPANDSTYQEWQAGQIKELEQALAESK
jgi:zinc/manganese transport system substrate-binding protein